MKKLKDLTLARYAAALSDKVPTPGGGSAAAYAGVLSMSLIAMSARYSVGKTSGKTAKKINDVIRKADLLREKFLELVDADAAAYQQVVRARKGTAEQKRKAARVARAVPKKIMTLCRQAIGLTVFLADHGNPHLLGDVLIAAELCKAAFQGAAVLAKE